jgi:hypothetical protein
MKGVRRIGHPGVITRLRSSRLPPPLRANRSSESGSGSIAHSAMEPPKLDALVDRAGTIIPQTTATLRDPTIPLVIVDSAAFVAGAKPPTPSSDLTLTFKAGDPDPLGDWAWQTGGTIDAIGDDALPRDLRYSRVRGYVIGGLAMIAAFIALGIGFGSRDQLGAATHHHRWPAEHVATPPVAPTEAVVATRHAAIVELGPPSVATEPPTPPVSPRPTDSNEVDVETAYRSGLRRFAHGDTTSAVSAFRALIAREPTHSASWRTLGIVYETRGDKARAHDAYRQYLRLVPHAEDAPQIRERMERLGS